MQKHNITEEDILNDAPNYSSKKLKIVTIEKSASKPETKSKSVAKNETKSVEKPEKKRRTLTKSKPLTKPTEEKKSKNPSNNKTKVHNRINNNLETRAKFIREKLAKQPQKSILKKQGTAI